MDKEQLRSLRQHYNTGGLMERDLNEDPFEQFRFWFKEASDSGIIEPNAMTLSTVDEKKPKSRIVLLKEINNTGLVFFTNYSSHKGKEIDENNNANLLFFWDKLARQIRIDGTIEKISREDSVEYFNSRPYESRIGALASNQSQIVNDRNLLVDKFNDLLEKYPDNPPCPEDWGGYILIPEKFEFWQGRESRLHDRLVYEFENNAWNIYRLSP